MTQKHPPNWKVKSEGWMALGDSGSQHICQPFIKGRLAIIIIVMTSLKPYCNRVVFQSHIFERIFTEQTLYQDGQSCLWEFHRCFSHACFFPEIGPASVMVGNLVSGKRIAQASGRDLGQIEDNDQARKVRAERLPCLGSCPSP